MWSQWLSVHLGADEDEDQRDAGLEVDEPVHQPASTKKSARSPRMAKTFEL